MEIFACPAKARRHSALRKVQDLGDFALGHLLDFEHRKHDPQVLLHLAQHSVQKLTGSIAVDLFVRPRTRIGPIEGQLFLCFATPVDGASEPRSHTDRGPMEEGALLAVCNVSEASPRNEEYLLSSVVRVAPGDAESDESAPNESEMIFDQCSQQARVAHSLSRQEGLVSKGFRSKRHGPHGWNLRISQNRSRKAKSDA
jgi:hypothetical protein